MARQVEFFRWWIVDERTGKRRRTTYKISREDAERQLGRDAEPDFTSREFRTIYEPGEAPANAKPT